MPRITTFEPRAFPDISHRRRQAAFPRGVCFARPDPNSPISGSRGNGIRNGGNHIGATTIQRFATLEEARESLGHPLVDELQEPGFPDAPLSLLCKYEWYQLLDGPHSSRGRYRTFYPDLDLLVRHQLTAEAVEAHRAKADLVALYTDKVGPFVLAVWEDAFSRSLLLPPSSSRSSLLPNGIFGNVPFDGVSIDIQGKINGDIIFKLVATDPRYMGLQLDERTRTIDPRIRGKNQEAFLRQLLGVDPHVEVRYLWREVMAKFLLLNWLKLHYGESPLRAFLANFPWMFEYIDSAGQEIPEGQHLHRTDFYEGNRWKNVAPAIAASPATPAWVEADHILRRHLGIQVIDPITGEIDVRLFPGRLMELRRELTAKVTPPGEAVPASPMFLSGIFRKAGLGAYLDRDGIDYNPGKLLAEVEPAAFSPTPERPEHLRTHWHKERRLFSNPEEVRSAVLHEIEVERIGIKDVPKRCNKPWFKKVHLEALVHSRPLVSFFKEYFPEYFADMTWHEKDFPPLASN